MKKNMGSCRRQFQLSMFQQNPQGSK
jgi:hypothetical protein